MRELPILFKGEMVRAILAGTKTQTRRVLQPQPVSTLPHTKEIGPWPDGTPLDLVHPKGKRWRNTFVADSQPGVFEEMLARHSPYGVAGDRLWVKETWQPIWATDNAPPHGTKSPDGWALSYPATDGVKEYHDPDAGLVSRCKPSIFMPRWASRITLEITGVRVERLQEISASDAKAEGVDLAGRFAVDAGDFVAAYAELWDSINAKRAPWESNPFVWRVEFRRVEVKAKVRAA